MGRHTGKRNRAIGLVSIEWAAVDVGYENVRGGMLRSLYPMRVKFNLKHVYISSLTPSPYKPIFKIELYLKFVIFGVRVKPYITVQVTKGVNYGLH